LSFFLWKKKVTFCDAKNQKDDYMWMIFSDHSDMGVIHSEMLNDIGLSTNGNGWKW
jgi:hypothetical protein